MKNNPPAGFGLIESVIALAIVAILAAIAFPVFETHLEKAMTTQALLLNETLTSQAHAYHAIHGHYPRLSDLGNFSRDFGTAAQTTFAQVNGPFSMNIGNGGITFSGNPANLISYEQMVIHQEARGFSCTLYWADFTQQAGPPNLANASDYYDSLAILTHVLRRTQTTKHFHYVVLWPDGNQLTGHLEAP